MAGEGQRKEKKLSWAAALEGSGMFLEMNHRAEVC